MNFPGNYTRIIGEAPAKLLEYAAFFLQLGIMFYYSGDNFYDAKVLSMNRKFNPVYTTVIIWFVLSMVTTCDRKEQIVSCVRVIETAFFAVWVSEHLTPKEITEDFCMAQLVLVISCILFATVFRQYYIRSKSYANDFVGIFGVKNQMASRLSFGLAMQVILWKIKLEKGEKLGIFFFGFLWLQAFLLLLTHGTGAILITVIPSLYLFFMEGKSRKRMSLGVIYDVGSIAFIVFALTIIPLFEPLLTAIGEDATLTGRIPLWRQMIKVMTSHKMFIGYGYGMFWKDPVAVNLMHSGFAANSWSANMTSGAHNSTLELWANTGVIGVAVYFWAMVQAFKKPEEIDRDAYIFCLIFVLRHMMHGFTERNWGTYEFSLLFLFIAMGMAASQRKGRKTYETGTELPAYKKQNVREVHPAEERENIRGGRGTDTLHSAAAEKEGQ